MPAPSVSMTDEFLDEIDDRRHSRTDRSTWIRKAIAARMDAEDADEWDEPTDWGDPVEAPAQ